jgi:hypothetical protein
MFWLQMTGLYKQIDNFAIFQKNDKSRTPIYIKGTDQSD